MFFSPIQLCPGKVVYLILASCCLHDVLVDRNKILRLVHSRLVPGKMTHSCSAWYQIVTGTQHSEPRTNVNKSQIISCLTLARFLGRIAWSRCYLALYTYRINGGHGGSCDDIGCEKLQFFHQPECRIRCILHRTPTTGWHFTFSTAIAELPQLVLYPSNWKKKVFLLRLYSSLINACI